MQMRRPLNHGRKRNKIDKMAFLTLFECVLSVSRNVYMYINTRIFPTTGYARVLLFIFIRRELGGTGTECLFQFTYCVHKPICN